MLSMLRKLPHPMNFWKSNFFSEYDPLQCKACGKCVKKCPVNAIKKKNGVIVKARPDVCIGCGLCVEACPSKALHLERRKPDMVPPKTNDDLYDAIMEKKKGTLGKLGVAVKMMLRV
jgi:ferredoxin